MYYQCFHRRYSPFSPLCQLRVFSPLKAQPQRIACAVIAWTTERGGAIPPGSSATFNAWVKTLQDHSEAADAEHPLANSEYGA